MIERFYQLTSWSLIVCAATLFASAEPTHSPIATKVDGLENFFQVTPKLWSGGEPTANGWNALRELGIKTVISVDGAPPNLQEARRVGIRYVHLPVGYSGVDRDVAIKIASAVQRSSGPVYLHCHHGKHRGPAAVALVCQTLYQWDVAQATSWMKQAGTSEQYHGLYRSVARFQPPSAAELAAVPRDLPERVSVPTLTQMMVDVDHQFEEIQRLEKNDFQPSERSSQAAVLLLEHWKEIARMGDQVVNNEDFANRLKEMSQTTKSLVSVLESNETARRQASSLVAALTKQCASCHAKHRDPAPPISSRKP